MTDYAPSLVVFLDETAVKHVQVSVVGSFGMIRRSYGISIAISCYYIIKRLTLFF